MERYFLQIAVHCICEMRCTVGLQKYVYLLDPNCNAPLMCNAILAFYPRSIFLFNRNFATHPRVGCIIDLFAAGDIILGFQGEVTAFK